MTMFSTARSTSLTLAAFAASATFLFIAHSASALPMDDDDAMQGGTKQRQAPPPPPPGQGAPAGNGDGGILKGPPVPPDAAQGKGGFGERDGKGGRGAMGPGPGRELILFKGAMKRVDGSLSDDQRTKIDSIRATFEKEMQAWREKNGARMQELERAARGNRPQRGEGRPAGPNGKDGTPGGTPGGAPGGTPGGAPGGAAGAAAGGDRQKMMEELQSLRASMPKFDAVRDQIMGVLTPEQQETVKEAMEEMRETMREMGGAGRPGRPEGRGGPAGQDGAPPKAPPPAEPPKGDYKFPD